MISKYFHIRPFFKSSSLVTIAMYIRLACGIYANISSNNVINLILRCYCILFATVTCYGRLHLKVSLSPSLFAIFEYVYSVILSQVTAEEYFFKFFSNIKIIDVILGNKQIPDVPFYVPVIFITCFTLRLTVCFFYGISFPTAPFSLHYWCSTFILILIQINYVIVIIIFALMHSRMKSLRIFWESNPVPVMIIGSNTVTDKIRHTRRSLNSYCKLLDNFNNIDTPMQYLMLSILLITPRFIMIAYWSLKYVFEEVPILISTACWLEALEVVLQASGPAIVAELTIYEVDRIKLFLNRQLLNCSDQSLRFDLEIALEYVTLRPFKFTICRAISVDVNLPVSVVSICITYVIALIQIKQFDL